MMERAVAHDKVKRVLYKWQALKVSDHEVHVAVLLRVLALLCQGEHRTGDIRRYHMVGVFRQAHGQLARTRPCVQRPVDVLGEDAQHLVVTALLKCLRPEAELLRQSVEIGLNCLVGHPILLSHPSRQRLHLETPVHLKL
jgi:hypothetical protein